MEALSKVVNGSHQDYAAEMIDQTARVRRVLTRCLACLAWVVGLGLTTGVGDAGADEAKAGGAAGRYVKVPQAAQAILPYSKVRVGMKGYGLTVYHGVDIVPFPFTVVSLEGDFNPQRPVIWVNCWDPRMQKSGPVAGMSGSPMYVWPEGVTQELGKNGLLIGAFAFGYSMSKDCYAGVQPIELMREAATRALAQGADAPGRGPMGGPKPGSQLRRLLEGGRALGLEERHTWRARAVMDLVTSGEHQPIGIEGGSTGGTGTETGAGAWRLAGPQGVGPGEARRLLVPLRVGSAELAALTAPLFEPLGFLPMRAPEGTSAGKPPAGIDPEAIRLEPGSMLSIPLAFGDADLSASGTVTDVLPDGRVLAFGHAMNGAGPSNLPVATGFVHFVQPSLTTSFKFSGGGRIAGALVQDENSAVVAMADGRFHTAPVTVRVKRPELPQTTYRYQVARDPMFTPVLTGIVAAQSLNAIQNLPREQTLRVTGKLSFEGGREYRFSSLDPRGSAMAILLNVAPAVSAMSSNDFGTAHLTAAEIDVEVLPEVLSASLVDVRMERAEVAPGETLVLHLRYQRFRSAPVEKRVELLIPQHLDEGAYRGVVTNAMGYNQWELRNRPHRRLVRSVDDLLKAQQSMANIRDDAAYVLLQLPTRGLAVGRTELPELPASRASLIASPTSTLARPFNDWIESVTSLDFVPVGEVPFTLVVRKPSRK